MNEFAHPEAPGFMITITNGRRFFVETKHWPRMEKDGNLTFDGENVFELSIVPVGQNQIQCITERLNRGPWKTIWIELRGKAIATIEKVSTESFIWQSVMKAKTNLILPNVQEIQPGTGAQGRQKFKGVK